MKKSRLARLLERLSHGSLRAHLFALVLVSVLPILIFAALVLNLFARQEKASLATGLRETARALTSAMDREFEATKTALEAAATLEVLDSGDLPQFYRVLRRVLQSRSNWKTIILQDPAGNQILNLLNPFGEPLPEVAAEEESFRSLIQSKRPTPINFHKGGPATGPSVGFRVPVLRSGELKYVLSVEMDPAVFRLLLARQKLPSQGIATIADARNIIVATTGSQELIGQTAGSLIGTASPAQLDGWIEEGPNHDGVRYYAAFSRSPSSGWFVALTAPAVLFEGPLKRSLWALGGAGVIFLVAGIIGAVIVESRISEPLQELTRKAEALGRGQPVAGNSASPIAEVEKLSQDIQRAAVLLVERERERDRAEGALRDSNDRLELRIQERTVQLEGANKELRKEISDRHAAEDALLSEHVYLNLLRSTELVSHEATGIEAVFGAALEEICRHLKWRVGHCLLESESADQDRRFSRWYFDSDWNSTGLGKLRGALESALNDGNPAARALATRELAHCSDLSSQPQRWASAAVSAGLVAACAFPVVAGGKPVGALAFFSDRVISLDSRLASILDQLALQLGRVVERQQAVEALRLSEERFRSAFDDGPIGIAMVDLKLRYLRVNQALCQMLGCQSGELLGQNLFDNVHPLDRPQSQFRAERLLMGEDHGYSTETRMITRSGEILWCCLTATIIAARDGRPNYALFLVENISQRKRMEEKLRESERLAAVGATSAMLAHEVGNPLNGISTTVQMIERDLSQPRDGVKPIVFSALADIRAEINRLGALLHEFRFLARPQHLELEPVRLDAMVRDVLAVEAYAARDIDIEIEIPENLPLLHVDQEKLTQVIANLVDNSADAMPQGGKLTVRAYLSGEEMLLEVRDTGIGIPPGVNVFEFFTTTKPNGTGLGLAVVRQIVSAHGGRVEYHSQVGKGTVFTVALPLDRGSRL
jgi:PAS domain S-box-containing protein